MAAFNSQSSSCSIRNRYISKLGIFPEDPRGKNHESHQIGKRCRTFTVDDDQRTSSVPVDDNDCLLVDEIPEISLKGLAFLDSCSSLTFDDDDSSFFDDEDDYADTEEKEEDTSFDSELQAKKDNRVQFRTSVAIYEVPSHRDYDDISHQNIWNSLKVQEQNAKRNAFEFRADKSDWRNACEEADMVKTRGGELVHPATWRFICEHMAHLHLQQKRQQAVARTTPKESSKHSSRELRRRLACAVGPPSSLKRFADT